MKNKILAGVVVLAVCAFSFWVTRDRVDDSGVPASGGLFGSGASTARVNTTPNARSAVLTPDSTIALTPEFREGVRLMVELHGKGETSSDRWVALIESLRLVVAGDPDIARAICDHIDRVQDAKLAVLFGQLMGASDDSDFLDELTARVQFADMPIARLAAVTALEGKPTECWLKVLVPAYLSDPDASVRAEALRVLKAHLADERFAKAHDTLRKELAKGAGSDLAD